MAQPYIGEIRMFGGNFAPFGWALCNGALLPISQYDALFNLIGTTYGGDGQNTFAVPDLQCRVPVHQGQGNGLSNYVIGTKSGVENVTLIGNQLPVHPHQALGSSASSGLAANPAGNTWGTFATSTNIKPFGVGGNATMNSASIGQTGGNQPHNNMVPFLAITFIIALQGTYPQQ
jgi:microcystin-dependent protein